MEKTRQYETIFKRKSVRKYDLKPLSDNILDEISDYISNTKSLFNDIKTEMRIVGCDEVRNLIPIKAPHYLIFYSEKKDGYLTNAGYIIQQIDLFLSSNGIGTCYLGMAQPKITDFNLEFVMILALGNAESVYRTNVSEFNRKSLNQITNITNNDRILEPARLAPSASNGQPWFFSGNEDKINAYCVKPNILKALLYEKMNKLDMGIALCHIAVAAEHYGQKVEFTIDENEINTAPKGYYYTTTISFK